MVELDELEVALGGRVHVAPLRGHVGVAALLDGLVHEAHVVRHILLELRGRDVDVLEEAHRHRDERLARPRVEPVDDRGRDERGELAASVAERVAHRRHAEHHVQVLAHAVKEKVPANVG